MEKHTSEIQKYGALFEVEKFLSEHKKTATRTFMRGAWALAELSIETEDDTERKRIIQAMIAFSRHPLGETILRISRQIKLSLEKNPDQTRAELTQILL